MLQGIWPKLPGAASIVINEGMAKEVACGVGQITGSKGNSLRRLALPGLFPD